MEEKTVANNRMIIINQGVIGPRTPAEKNINIKSPGDYPDVPRAFMDAAKLYSSPRFMGPPICDEFMALIQHMFTEEEASIVRHFSPFARRSAAWIAKKSNRPVAEAKAILDHLAWGKFILVSMGEDEARRYMPMPIVPGTFEAVMATTSIDKLNEWQKEFARLFETLHETGFMTDYFKFDTPAVRYFPIAKTIEAHPMALPSDRLEEVFDRYDTFAVTHCQCRMTEIIAGRGCEKPLENCVVFGEPVKMFADHDKVRMIDKKEALEIKLEAEAAGLVSWMINEESGKFVSSSCSCCGDCCHMMRSVTEFNMPAAIAVPHFRPSFDMEKCNHCAKCATRCPMGAITVDMKGKTHAHEIKRCVGCGQCVIACEKKKAIQMDAIPDYKKPPKSYLDMAIKMTPNALRNSWSAWRARK